MKQWFRISATLFLAITLLMPAWTTLNIAYSQDMREHARNSTTTVIRVPCPNADAYVASGASWRDHPRGKSNGLFVGYEEGLWNLNKTRSLLYFDLSTLGKDIRITRAELQLYHIFAIAPKEGEQLPIRVYPLTAPWNEETVTWNNQPPYDPQRLLAQTNVGTQVNT